MSQDWDQRYAGSELVCSAEPNRFLVAEGRWPSGRARSTSGAERDATRSGWCGRRVSMNTYAPMMAALDADGEAVAEAG